MRLFCGTTLAVLWVFAAVAQVPIVDGGGATLDKIAGTETMVTIVLKEKEAEDPNLHIRAVNNGYVTVVSSDGQENYYRLEDIKAIRVQGGEVTTKPFVLQGNRGLTSDQQQVVSRAAAKAKAVFDESAANLPLRMDAATLLIVAGDDASKEAAKNELMGYVGGNDLPTALKAAYQLFLAGDPEPARGLIKPGLDSGNWNTRVLAANLAGLIGDKSDETLLALNEMLKDRSGETSGPALRALARLGMRNDVLPAAFSMLSQGEDKAEAAVSALSQLGGEDVIEKMKTIAGGDETGLVRFRATRVLWALGDPMGAQLLRDEMMEIPTLRIDSALLLATKSDVKAVGVLRDRLNRRYDVVENTLILRAEIAAALLVGGDRSDIGVLQELLRAQMPAVEKRVSDILVRIGMPSLIAILQPTIETNDAEVALSACRAVIALANADFRERLSTSPVREKFGVGPV